MFISTKHIFKCILLAGLFTAMQISLSSCTTDDDDDDDKSTTAQPDQTDDRWPACDATAQTQTVSFVHVSDIHGHYNTEPGGESPVARMRGFYEQVRAENPYTLFTNGGDDHEKGSVAEELSGGISTTEVTNAMAFDIRVIGDHDFAFGPEELLSYSRDPQAVVLASNTEYAGSDEDDFGAVDYAELQVGCLRIGFFSLVSMPWNEKNTQYAGNFYPDNDDYQSDWDWAGIANTIIAEHGDDVDLMVLVSHLGIQDDVVLAGQVTGIDVFLGGHTHTALTSPTEAEGALIVHPGAFAEYVSRLDLTVNLSSGDIADYSYELLDNVAGAFPVDEDLQEAVDNILETYAPDMHDPMTTVAENQDEEGIALLAGKAAIDYFGADAVVVNKNTVWSTWTAGTLSMQDILDAFKVERKISGTPGFNSFYWASVNGTDLRRIKNEMPSQYLYSGEEAIDIGSDYTIMIQKAEALNPADYLPTGVTITDVAYEDEVWRLVEAYGRARQIECLYIDTDETIDGCE